MQSGLFPGVAGTDYCHYLIQLLERNRLRDFVRPGKMTLEELTAQRDALLAARFRGVRTVEIDGRRVTYASDTELAAAITDLERRIAEPRKAAGGAQF
jgi:hypothetical protein